MTLWKILTAAAVILAAGSGAAQAQPAPAAAAPARFTAQADTLMKAYVDADSFAGAAKSVPVMEAAE